MIEPTSRDRGPMDAHGTEPASTSERERLICAHERAAAYFAEQLHTPDGVGPRPYLERRGLGPALASPVWSIGYAPSGWTALTDHLRSAGYTDRELLLAGLAVTTRRDTIVDRFRDRVTLGIRNTDGELVAFVGRAAPQARQDVPKYLNSPSTPIYDKGAVLFGLAEQQEIHDGGATVVLVEGPLDVLAVSEANAPGGPKLAAVAPCGTALTSAQARALSHVVGDARLVVAFDSDRAGQRAAATAYSLLSREISHLDAASLPRGSDPAELLTIGGPPMLRAALADTQPLADRVVDRVLERYRDRDDNAEARVCALHEVAPVVASLHPREVGREVARVSAALGFDHPLVTEQVAEATAINQRPSRKAPTAARRRTLSTDPRPERAGRRSMRLD